MARKKDFDISSLIEFIHRSGNLKNTARTGWMRYSIPEPESVADHSFRTALLAMILAPFFEVDHLKAIKMALVHDLGEAIVGDIVTDAGGKELSNLAEKLQVEREAIKDIFTPIDSGHEYVELFDEFQHGTSNEAVFVNQLDKLEMAFQAAEYEKLHKINLEDFFTSAKRRIDDDRLLQIISGLRGQA